MKDILMFIVKSIVDQPDQVTISEEETEGIINYIISVDNSDMGRIIGKEGKIIRSIRNIMKIPAMKQGKRINISIAETASTA